MKRTGWKALAAALGMAILGAAAAGGWYIRAHLPQRNGMADVQGLEAPVSVRYDERGVPHIRAEHEADLYRALGYVHAQDRLFQMEMVRRLAKGELADILGPELVEVDTLFRTLGLRDHARKYVAQMDKDAPSYRTLLAYLDGINQFQDHHSAPLEFDLLKITPQPFTPEDTVAVAGYLAYSFAAAFSTEPVMTHIRDQLGAQYLTVFDTEWHSLGVIEPLVPPSPSEIAARAGRGDDDGLQRLAQVSQRAQSLGGVPLFQGSNAWAISGKRTASGKPLLAGDPHIGFSVPAVWYEAHLSMPGFELYGHYQALNPVALLGHNMDFGWSLTMFENDDIDLIAERTNPANANQVWHNDQWVEIGARQEVIHVKGAPDKLVTVRSTPHGPVINDAFSLGKSPVSMWWAFLQTENPILDALYALNRADTRDKARAAASRIHAPGLNIVWANAAGDIGWWAAGKLPVRPGGVNPMFILDAAKGEAEKAGFYNFNFNPQEENPARGYIVSANHQPKPASGVPVPGYYLLPDRVQRLDEALRGPDRKWDTAAAEALQLDAGNGYAKRVLKPLMPILESVVTDPVDRAFLEPLQKWDGSYGRDSIAATIFTQFCYELAKAAFADELGDERFQNLLQTPALDHALPLLAADEKSPWWDNVTTKAPENRYETTRTAWLATLAHLRGLYGNSLLEWRWGNAHTLTQVHPIGMQQPFNLLFNIGPYPAPGGRETPNNLSSHLGPAPWAVSYGPSTRRVVDFADASKAVGINPAGQSGVLFDRHYADQTDAYMAGQYMPQYLNEADVQAHTRSTLTLNPAH